METTQQISSHLTIEQQQIIEKTIVYVQEMLADDKTGHDWWHIQRVWQTALYIGQQEGADLFTVQIAALLHDIADWKFHNGDEWASAKSAKTWLLKHHVSEPLCEQISEIVYQVTFKGAGVKTHMSCLAGKVVQDADRLDAIGAIGIARAFTYGGCKQRSLYDPEIAPILHSSFEDYKKSQSTTINHFYEKMLLLKDLMNTATGKKLAEQRHLFIEQYLEQFFKEWNCQFN
jgi:uncharacterized protein